MELFKDPLEIPLGVPYLLSPLILQVGFLRVPQNGPFEAPLRDPSKEPLSVQGKQKRERKRE